MLPVAADITTPFRLPSEISGLARAGFFPGSTIGNFEPHQAAGFLHNAARILGPGAMLIVGVDLAKDPAILNAAYDDAAGVTAQFNLNLLRRINRELGAHFDLDAFSHQAFYNTERKRVEMHLASRKRQTVEVCGRMIEFRGRRDDPHREQLQIHDRVAGRARARLGLVPDGGVDRPAGLFLGACAGDVGPPELIVRELIPLTAPIRSCAPRRARPRAATPCRCRGRP